MSKADDFFEELAPAKINLFLHVGGLRADRLHDLESVFAFIDVGDRVIVCPAPEISLTLSGPFAGPLLSDDMNDNLVVRAALALQDYARSALGVSTAGAAIHLEKNLPVAAGIGGGSADAAATLRALCRLWSISPPAEDLHQIAFRLGADIPACLHRQPVAVSGAGEVISPIPALPPLWAVLVNPLKPTLTGPIFRAFDKVFSNPPAPRKVRSARRTLSFFLQELAATTNDLEPLAKVQVPEIKDIIEFLEARPGALTARMSGSGATCFGLFTSATGAKRASSAAGSKGWWSRSGRIF